MSHTKRIRVKKEVYDEDSGLGAAPTKKKPKKTANNASIKGEPDDEKTKTKIKKDGSETKLSSSGGSGGGSSGNTEVCGVVTLLNLLDEKGMQPSRDYNNDGKWIGKGPRNERELLRFYADVGKIAVMEDKLWQWKTTDPDLVLVRRILDEYKGGMRAPPRKKWNDLKEARASGSPAWEKYNMES